MATIPSNDVFIEHAKRLHIRKTDKIVIYEDSDVFCTGRVWYNNAPNIRWMFLVYGARDVSILQGGRKKWEKEGKTIEKEASNISEAQENDDFSYVREDSNIAWIKDVYNIAHQIHHKKTEVQIIDARPAVAFEKGHITGAKNCGMKSLLDEQGKFISDDDMKKKFEECDIDITKPTIISCGAGVTANVINFGLIRLGNNETKVYDGSWGEYVSS